MNDIIKMALESAIRTYEASSPGVMTVEREQAVEALRVLQLDKPAVELERVEAHLDIDGDVIKIVIEPDPEGSLVYYDNVVRALQSSGEPVAWMYEHDGMVHDEFHQPVFTTRRWDFVNEPYTESPLYTTPQPVVEGLDFDFIAAVLEDYCFLQTSGIIAPANRYATSDVNEQVALLSAGKENNNE